MTEIAIDKSNLPRVREVCRGFAVLEDGALAHNLQEQEIEQHYASNIEKNKLVRQDVCVAKKLQDEEELEAKHYSREHQQQIEELDSQYAKVVQEEIEKHVAESLQREEQDKEVARRLQQEEELRDQRRLVLEAEIYAAGEEMHRATGRRLWHGHEQNPLDREVAQLNLSDSYKSDQEQLQRDEALARLLQEEEEVRMVQLRSRSQRNQEEDFRAAQVAQDEEIAKYIQRQELKAHKQSKRLEERLARREYSGESSECSDRQQRPSQAAPTPQERLNSEGFPSPSGEQTPERGHSPTEQQSRHLFPRNIAEELDPTFKTKNLQHSSDPFSAVPPALPQPCTVPPDSFYDYLDESSKPTLVSPTRRQEEKLVRQKSKEKKEGCKQQ
ncbi:coiled-coil domain-containing protein 50-like isoform X2 [Stegostoma tigrinum]|nr:coiled-coil domain-containing protein 50-like isoform X2 [Stegostoma tigrinum]XP_059511638.1 coiled-coil domain-containing protein 50-like isoform X2 [Stegostoma tigrinum]XP_059511639.1 coiled-coil domain-containing protein 50-like isoform X2 [Stegostoma tigrinum]XP_059511640.1 coiled-coil domain-containing protein 50-like isoform X2 [Stegostoma tigrinum]XP_059511641.1 coiled-coil domain-containing protein 50-like isoform X2 [Stegostoma tigrinum]